MDKQFLINYTIPSGLKDSAGYYYPKINITETLIASNELEAKALIKCLYTELQINWVINLKG